MFSQSIPSARARGYQVERVRRRFFSPRQGHPEPGRTVAELPLGFSVPGLPGSDDVVPGHFKGFVGGFPVK